LTIYTSLQSQKQSKKIEKEEENRGKKHLSIFVHSLVGLIIGLFLAYFSLNETTKEIGPKMWTLLGNLIIIVLYFPIFFIMRHKGYPSFVAEFFVYFIMALGSWFSFYPFLIGMFHH